MYHYIVINNKLLATENGLVAVRPMAYTVNGFRPDENGNVNVDVSEQLYEFVGKENRLGFNGVLQGKKITFTLDESVSNFELKNSTGYLFNLHLPLVETIDQDYTFEILDKDNNVINLHCIYSQKENETSTVGDFKQLQEYSTSTGYSWDFYGHYYENTNSLGETKRVIYSDSVVRESVDTEKGEIFYNKLLANKYTVGQVVICSENYSMNGTKLEKGHIYKVIQENIVDGEIVLGYVDITPETGYSKAEIDTFLSSKVDAVEGKGLSTNDYTNEDKALVGTIQDVQEVQEVDVDTTPIKNSGNLITSGGVYSQIGDLTTLGTTDKSSLVNAINEVKNSAGGETATLIWSGKISMSSRGEVYNILSNDEGKKYKRFVLKYMINGQTSSSICENPYDTWDDSTGFRTYVFKISAGNPRTYSGYRYIPLGGSFIINFANDKRLITDGDGLNGLKIKEDDKTIDNYYFSNSLSPEWGTGSTSNGYIKELYGIK